MCKMEHPLLYWLPCPPKKLGGLYPTLTVVCFISFFLLSTETECINYVVVGITVIEGSGEGYSVIWGHLQVIPLRMLSATCSSMYLGISEVYVTESCEDV